MLGRAQRRRFGWILATVTLAGAGHLGAEWAEAQAQSKPGRTATPGAAGAATAKAAPTTTAPAAGQAQAPAVTIKPVAIPVNPTDPIAVVNGEVITRQQLADECVAMKGEEILETLIARRLINQAIRNRKIEVTAAEVDAEIERVARTMAGVSRDRWLATLAKERKISPAQYARDIIYPTLALRKLAAPQVQVTDQDVKEALESQFGEKLRCRMIMLNTLPVAKQVWEEVKKNPALFEKIAQERSVDQATRSLGGLLPEPIARHSYPRNVSDAAFEQLVDGIKLDPSDPNAKVDEKYKPKDGDISGIIQLTETTWIILKREGLIPAKTYDPNDQMLVAQVKKSIFDAKVQERIAELFAELMREAEIENRLTGSIKPSGTEEAQVRAALGAQSKDNQVQPTAAPGAATKPITQNPPAALSSQDAQKANEIKAKK